MLLGISLWAVMIFPIADPDPQSHSHIVPSMSIQYCTRVAGGAGWTNTSIYVWIMSMCLYIIRQSSKIQKVHRASRIIVEYLHTDIGVCIVFVLLLQCETNHAIYCSMFLDFNYGELLPTYSWLFWSWIAHKLGYLGLMGGYDFSEWLVI